MNICNHCLKMYSKHQSNFFHYLLSGNTTNLFSNFINSKCECKNDLSNYFDSTLKEFDSSFFIKSLEILRNHLTSICNDGTTTDLENITFNCFQTSFLIDYFANSTCNDKNAFRLNDIRPIFLADQVFYAPATVGSGSTPSSAHLYKFHLSLYAVQIPPSPLSKIQITTAQAFKNLYIRCDEEFLATIENATTLAYNKFSELELEQLTLIQFLQSLQAEDNSPAYSMFLTWALLPSEDQQSIELKGASAGGMWSLATYNVLRLGAFKAGHLLGNYQHIPPGFDS